MNPFPLTPGRTKVTQQGPGLRVPGPPLKLTATPPTVRRHPPMLGEHNEEILADAGFDPDQISRMRQKGVIGAKATSGAPTSHPG